MLNRRVRLRPKNNPNNICSKARTILLNEKASTLTVTGITGEIKIASIKENKIRTLGVIRESPNKGNSHNAEIIRKKGHHILPIIAINSMLDTLSMANQ